MAAGDKSIVLTDKNVKTINGESVLGNGDITTVTPTGTQTLTNKTISVDNNTVSGIAASSFVLSNSSGNIDGAAAQKAIPAGVVVGTTDTQTLTNKTIVDPILALSETNGLAGQVPISQGVGLPPVWGATITGLKETRVAIASSAIDLSAGNYFTKTITKATTFTVSNVPASGTVASVILELTNGGSSNVTWFSGVTWAGGTAPTLTAAGVDVLGFYTTDGGTIWRGLVLALDIKAA